MAKKPLFERIADVVVRRHKAIVVLWIAVALGSLYLNSVYPVDDILSFSQTDVLPEDTESSIAQDIADAQFPGRIPASGLTIVVVGENMTTAAARDFVLALDDAVVAASTLGSGQTTSVPIGGETLLVDRPVAHLMDPANSTIYAVYEGFATVLARQYAAALPFQLNFTRNVVLLYFGLPGYFIGLWPFGGNASAYNATASFITTSGLVPADQQPFVLAYLDAFYGGWLASFGNASMGGFPPQARAEDVIAQALPAFLDTQGLAPSDRDYLVGFSGWFNLTNFLNASLADEYVYASLTASGDVDRSFLLAVNATLPENVTEAEARAFARSVVRNHTLADMPFRLPFDAHKFYVSADDRILLVNYDFREETRFRDANGTQPVMENVVNVRDLAARLAVILPGFTTYVSGTAASEYDQREIFSGGKEVVATVILIICLIGIFFRSVLTPWFPLTAIGMAISLSFLFVYVVGFYLLTVDVTILAVLQTVLLATGTDYSIFLLSRYRDERLDGKPKRAAVHTAVTWAGESIATSGGAVIISFAALSLGSFPFVRALGITIGAAVTLAIVIAVTFVPGILLLAGDRVFWPYNRRMKRARKARRKGERTLVERYFERSAKFSMRHAKAIVVAALLVTVPTTYVILTSRPSFDLSKGAEPTESSIGLEVLKDAFGAGLFLRTFVVVQFPDSVYAADGNFSTAKLGAVDALVRAIEDRHPMVQASQGPTNPQEVFIDYANVSSEPEPERSQLLGAMGSFIGEDNRTVRLFLVLREDVFSLEAINEVEAIHRTVVDVRAGNPELAAATIHIGGVSAILGDLRVSTDRDLLLMAAIVFVVLYVLLLVVLGSVLIPLRSILTILLSISWTLAVSIVVFQVWKGLDLIFILPLIVFVLAMGLGMDYDIFIITRVREEVARGKSDPEAIYTAMKRTGAIISAAGAIMAGSFFSLMISPSPVVVQIGFALAFVILLDSMVVRIYLVPAILVLAGKYNWWAPGRLQRVRRENKPVPEAKLVPDRKSPKE